MAHTETPSTEEHLAPADQTDYLSGILRPEITVGKQVKFSNDQITQGPTRKDVERILTLQN